MLEERRSLTQHFHKLLLTVVGQAFAAAGYIPEENPIQQAGGLFRFQKQLDAETTALIEFQLLVYTDTAWASGKQSRFRVNLRREGNKPVSRLLSALLVEDFGVLILPSADHWWTFRDPASLGHALAQAGQLAVGYAIPWLDGELHPPNQQK